jgi:glycosyltransferase involved in cell wall biosynthesis
VIVPVRNRRALLRRTLDALARQQYPSYEVLVVDDGSSDGSPEEAQEDARKGRPVTLVRGSGTGSMAARGEGARLAKGEYLAFTDSDCEPTPLWLEAGVAALDVGNDVVSGLTLPARPPGPLERVTVAGAEGLYATCNVFYRRDAFVREGGFDEARAKRLGFRAGSKGCRLGTGEDTFLAWSVRRSGPAAFAPDAVVRHHVFHPDLADSFSRAWLARVFPPLVREIPELREAPLFRYRLQVGSRSRVPLYALAASVVSRRPILATVAATCWVYARAAELHRGPGSLGEKVLALPVELALDAVTGAALVAASVRARTVVL